jgi:hypothetical protein
LQGPPPGIMYEFTNHVLVRYPVGIEFYDDEQQKIVKGWWDDIWWKQAIHKWIRLATGSIDMNIAGGNQNRKLLEMQRLNDMYHRQPLKFFAEYSKPTLIMEHNWSGRKYIPQLTVAP